MNRRPHAVQISLTGTAEDVRFWLGLLDDIATLTELTTPYHDPTGKLCVRAVVTRTAPLRGGPR